LGELIYLFNEVKTIKKAQNLSGLFKKIII